MDDCGTITLFCITKCITKCMTKARERSGIQFWFRCLNYVPENLIDWIRPFITGQLFVHDTVSQPFNQLNVNIFPLPQLLRYWEMVITLWCDRASWVEPGVLTIPAGSILPRMLGDRSQPSGRDIPKDRGELAYGIR